MVTAVIHDMAQILSRWRNIYKVLQLHNTYTYHLFIRGKSCMHTNNKKSLLSIISVTVALCMLSVMPLSAGYTPGLDDSLHPSTIHTDTETVSYELLIIAPRRFTRLLDTLVEHKTRYGITTVLVSVEEIYQEMTQGRDDAEKIKYFIKQSYDEWNIRYVLLVGGMKHQRVFSWYVPVRYVQMDDDWESQYITDLYYADIIDGGGNFSSWDADGDGLFGEWYYGMPAEDQEIDLYPDIAVGRLPCRNRWEVRGMVSKIITYETTAYGAYWFNDMIAVAGDTYLEQDNPLWAGYEGEEYADQAFENMSGFNPIRLYASEGTFTGEESVVTAFNRGCGFVYFVGHGNPMSWGNHPPNDDTFIDGLTVHSMRKLKNGVMTPVCVVSGCHNSQFDVSLLRLINRRSRWVGEATRECWGWRMTHCHDGGSIATLGCTALGYTKEDKDSFEGGLNEVEVSFFTGYGQQNITRVGDTWMWAITQYLDNYTPIDWHSLPISDPWIDVKVVQSWALFGDPSLQIGGYPS